MRKSLPTKSFAEDNGDALFLRRKRDDSFAGKTYLSILHMETDEFWSIEVFQKRQLGCLVEFTLPTLTCSAIEEENLLNSVLL